MDDRCGVSMGRYIVFFDVVSSGGGTSEATRQHSTLHFLLQTLVCKPDCFLFMLKTGLLSKRSPAVECSCCSGAIVL
jgi:hypothetical protein